MLATLADRSVPPLGYWLLSNEMDLNGSGVKTVSPSEDTEPVTERLLGEDDTLSVGARSDATLSGGARSNATLPDDDALLGSHC